MRNPYEVYKKAEKASLTGKNLEVAALVKGARLLRECQKKWTSLDRKEQLNRLGEACKYNQRIWSVFEVEAMKEENPLPADLKKNILLLSEFIDKKLLDALAYAAPDNLSQVIKINLNIAAGLRGSPEGDLPFDLD